MLEVVCGADDGEVFAWHADGSLVSGFPVQPFVGTFAGPPALAQLDGSPGLEIVALSRTGEAHVLKGDGSELAGWPVTTGATNLTFSPVVARLGSDPEPAVLLPGNAQLCAYRPNGTLRWSVALGANPTQEPALGDLDGDGFDDIVCAANTSLARVDSAGVMATAANWPLALGAAAGTPVIGPLRAGGLPAVMLARSNALVRVRRSRAAAVRVPRAGPRGRPRDARRAGRRRADRGGSRNRAGLPPLYI